MQHLIDKIGTEKLILDITVAELIKYIKQVHKAGGINTICWHMGSPWKEDIKNENFKNNNKGNAINAVCNENDLSPDAITTREKFNKILEIASWFFHCLVTDETTITNQTTNTTTIAKSYPIPVIFRPFHEPKTDMNDCFWWSNIEKDDAGLNEKKVDPKDPKKLLKSLNETAAENYKQLWQKLQNKFDGNGVNNVLYSFCLQDEFIDAKYENNKFESFTQDLKPFIYDLVPEKYDIIGFDAYQRLGLDKYHELTKDNFNHYIAVNYYKENDWLLGWGSYKKFTKEQFTKRLELQYNALQKLPNAKGKIYSIQEIGADFMNFNPNWFTEVMQDFLNKKQIAYFTMWRNPNRGDIGGDPEKNGAKTKVLNYDLKNSIDFQNPEIDSLDEYFKKKGHKWSSTTYKSVKEYYIPFIQDYKYPSSI